MQYLRDQLSRHLFTVEIGTLRNSTSRNTSSRNVVYKPKGTIYSSEDAGNAGRNPH